MASLGQESWPFLFKVPYLECESSAAGATSSRLDTMPVEPAPEFQGWQPEWARTTVVQAPTPGVGGHAQEQLPQPEGLATNPDDLLYLRAVVEHACQPVSFYPSHLHIGNARAIKIRKGLISKGLVREEKLATGSRGRPSLVLVPTDEGKKFLAARAAKPGGP